MRADRFSLAHLAFDFLPFFLTSLFPFSLFAPISSPFASISRATYARVSFPLTTFPGSLANVKVKTPRSQSCYLCREGVKRAPSWIFGAAAEIAEVRLGKTQFRSGRRIGGGNANGFEETSRLQRGNCTLRDYTASRGDNF